MIKSARQRQTTQSLLADFEQVLSELEVKGDDGVSGVARKAQMDALHYQIREFRRELEEYDALRDSNLRVLELASFADLPRGLIQARIAAGLTQRELAARLGLKEQQIQHYEATEYASASLRRVQQIIDALGVQVSEEIVLSKAASND